jgi:hypothetical protein
MREPTVGTRGRLAEFLAKPQPCMHEPLHKEECTAQNCFCFGRKYGFKTNSSKTGRYSQ